MSKYRYLVYGGGGMGIPLVRDLRKHGEAAAITLIEPNDAQRRRAARQMSRFKSDDDAPITYLKEPNEFVLQNASAIVSAAPHAANAAIAREAMRYGIPYCDLGGSHEVAAIQKRDATLVSLPVVSGVGASPGTVSIVVADFAERLGCKRIEAYCGGLPYPEPDPKKNPLKYQCTWSREGLAHEYCGKTIVLRGGAQEVRCKEVRALANAIPFTLEYGPVKHMFEAVWTSNNPAYGIDYLRKLGVWRFDYRTLRYPGHLAALERLVSRNRNGLFDEARMLSLFKNTPALMFDRGKDCDWMIHVVRGSKELRGEWEHEHIFVTHKDPISGFTAMELSTSWGASIGTHALASGRWRPYGFATPEMCGERRWYLDELKRRLIAYNMYHPRQFQCAA